MLDNTTKKELTLCACLKHGESMSRLRIIATLLVVLTPVIVFDTKTEAAELSTQARSSSVSSFDDTGWQLQYNEQFDSNYTATHGQIFGQDGWLIYQILNGGTISIANGYAKLTMLDFWNAGLIRSTSVLPDEYKIRIKVGHINYDLTNYEQADYDDPRFATHSGYYENGMYFLTLTDDTCIGNQCAEDWWHLHRRIVIDIDNHLNWGGGGETFHPVFMVYMAPEMNAGGNLLRTWDGNSFDTTAWNWNVAYTYSYDTWYYAEVEKRDGFLTLRLYDANQNILEETTPVPLDLIFGMPATPEYMYTGEPHTDDYEGDVLIDDITLLIPETYCCGADSIRGDVDGVVGPGGAIEISDFTYMVNYLFQAGPPPPCMAEGNVDGLTGPGGPIDVVDLTFLMNHVYRGGPPPPSCN